MATSTSINCICLKNGKFKAAFTLCSECESALCNLCRDRHNQSNKTINHRTSVVEELSQTAQMPIRDSNMELGIAHKFNVKMSDSEQPRGVVAFCLLPNRDFVFVDREGMFTICNIFGSFKNRFAIDLDEIRDITSIGDFTIAVAAGKDHVTLVNIKQKQKMAQTLPTSNACYGLDYNNGLLWMGTYGGGLYSANLSEYTISKFFSISGSILYVTTSQNNVCMSNSYEDTVTLFDPLAKVIWKFLDKDLLRSPNRLTSDANGNIYVLNSSGVVCISAHGKQARKLIDSEYGIGSIADIHYDNAQHILITVNTGGNVVIYNCP